MNQISKSIAILNCSAPFSKPSGKDALDVALIFGAYEQPTSLFFQGDGVWQLVNKQRPEQISMKNYLKTFSAFEFYDIDKVYVCQDSLNQRALTSDFHIEDVSIVTADKFSKLLHQHHIIFRF